MGIVDSHEYLIIFPYKEISQTSYNIFKEHGILDHGHWVLVNKMKIGQMS